ncbi:MAG: GGDEF domain-containing protein, partial [Paraglaciecola sp.]|nr:GGDEF domain-containing protein [Paraglaciecola sp.]
TQLKKLLLFLSLVPLFLVVLIPFLSLHEFLLVGHSLRTFYLIVSLCYAVFVIRRVWLKPKGQRLQLLGVLIILISGSYDAYLYAQNIDPYIELFAVAMFVFIAAQAMYFGWKHILLLRREQSLTLNLKELNESLEGQIRSRTRDLQSANASLSRAALTDVLTNLPNRRAFDANIESEILRAQCNDQNLCLAIVDVDWFKTVNDRFGHDFGDKVLQTLSAFIRNRLRMSDFVARIGGEEFAIILPLTDIHAANILLNQLCTEITKLEIDTTKDYHLSISIGCTQWHKDLSIDELYKLADQALYKAKNSGRGRVEISH